MNLSKIFICGLICISFSAFAGISDVGNGGDVIACFDRGEDKLFSLDFALTKGQFPDDKLAQVSFSFQSLERIQNLIKLKVPSLSRSYAEFVDLIKNPNASFNQVWVAAESPLTDIDDEQIITVPTYICPFTRYSTSKGELRQAIIRQVSTVNGTKKIKYFYDKEIFDYLHQEAPLQFSFLLVHEWLWSLNTKVDENRSINYFLHSKSFENLSATEVVARLKELGLTIQ